MNVRFLFLSLCVLLGLSTGAAQAQAVRLAMQPAIGPQQAAFPRVADARTPAEKRVNQALDQADARLRSAVRACNRDAKAAQADPKDAGWQRQITVTMRGAGYLSFFVSDQWYCGGAYPSAGSFALAYDLHTGAPLNWQRLLPRSLVSSAMLDSAGDGTRLGFVASPALTALYLKTDKPESDCLQELQMTSLQFMLWPDAKAEGVGIEPASLPHAWAACGNNVVLSLPMLRKLGVAPALLDAIAVAHSRGFYGSGS